MRRLLIIPLLAVGLLMAGCSTITNPFTSSSIDKLNAAYGTVVAVAANYNEACAARRIHNSCRIVVPKMQGYVRKADVAVLAARRFVRENPTINPASAMWVAYQTINDLKNFQTAQGVN